MSLSRACNVVTKNRGSGKRHNIERYWKINATYNSKAISFRDAGKIVEQGHWLGKGPLCDNGQQDLYTVRTKNVRNIILNSIFNPGRKSSFINFDYVLQCLFSIRQMGELKKSLKGLKSNCGFLTLRNDIHLIFTSTSLSSSLLFVLTCFRSPRDASNLSQQMWSHQADCCHQNQ